MDLPEKPDLRLILYFFFSFRFFGRNVCINPFFALFGQNFSFLFFLFCYQLIFLAEKLLYFCYNIIHTTGMVGVILMKKPKWRVEYVSPLGEKITITLEGTFNNNKIKQFLDLLEIFATSTSSEYSLSHNVTSNITKQTKTKGLKERILLLLNKRFHNRWFTSKDVAAAFYDEYSEIIPENVISTYLSRFYYRGILLRRGTRARRQYTISPKITNEL